MIQPVSGGSELIAEIDSVRCATPRLWRLGHAGFVLKYLDAIIYVDPLLSAGEHRLSAPPLKPDQICHAGLVLCTHAHPGHMDAGTLHGILGASPKSKVVMPITAAERAREIGISYDRMVTTNASLRVEFLDDRVYAVPSAHDQLDWTPQGGFPYLGYLIRFGRYTIYHAGDGVFYDRLASLLMPYNVNVALLPVAGAKNFSVPDAARLAADIGADWLVPMHYDMFPESSLDVDRFIEHMLGHHPAQRFKVFQCGEGWTIPAE